MYESSVLADGICWAASGMTDRSGTWRRFALLRPVLDAFASGEGADRPQIPRGGLGALLAFVMLSAGLIAAGQQNYPGLHAILDTAMCLMSGLLALLLWDMASRLDRPFQKWLAVAFLVTFVLEFIHVTVTVEWTGALAPVHRAASDLRPLTWPPAAITLPVAIAASLWLLHRGSRRVAWFSVATVIAAVVLFFLYQRAAPYAPPGLFAVTRPSLMPAPLLWAGVAWFSWRMRKRDRALPSIALMAVTLFLANLVMLYSWAPHDTQAMVAHLGKVAGYVSLVLALMHLASLDMIERVRAEAKLARLNEELDARVQEQTAVLQTTNERLRAEMAARRKSHELLKAVTENTPAVIYVKDLDGRYLMINPRFAEIFQIDAATTIGKTDHDLFGKEAADAFRAMDQRVAEADRALTEEEEAPHHDGIHTYISVKSPLRDEHGAPYAVFGISTDITDLKHAQQALSESEERSRLIVETALDAVIGMDDAGVVTDWSPQAATTFGWTRKEALGLHLAQLIIPKRHRAGHESGLKRYLATGEARVLNQRIEVTALHRDGHEFPVELSITAIRSGGAVTFSGFARDISERKQAEAKLAAQFERMALLDQISRAIGERQDLGSIFQVAVRSVEDQLPADFVCLCLFDRAQNALVVARVGAKSAPLSIELALTEQGLIPIDENGLARCVSGHLVYEPDVAASAFPFPQRLAGGGLRSFVAAPLAVESQVFGALIVARVAGDGFVSGECEFLRQLSEHVALASNQAQLTAALQQAYDDLRRTQDAVMQQERLRALGQMASGIAHDINNALSPISLFTESILMMDRELSAASRGKLEVIQRAIDDAAHTVSRMKDFYRQRETQLDLAPASISTLVRQVLDLTQSRWKDMAQERGVEIEMRVELAPDLPAVLGVESELREALINLVFNAVDALPNGGTVSIRGQAIPKEGLVSLEVNDNGVGMDEATRQRCLEPFFTTKGEAGSGLGLAMVYGVVQRHGADLEIVSAPGEGTTIRLTFAAADAPTAPMASDAIAGPIVRMRLLLIDDDPILLRSLGDVLAADGHAITSAGDGHAGLAAFHDALRDGKPFDAVITDLGMPKLDGRRVAQAIKEASPQTPVLLLTGWGERLMAEEEMPAHIDRVLSKPPKLRELRAALAESSGAMARAIRG
jgi:PAS domain S-box-containing protein